MKNSIKIFFKELLIKFGFKLSRVNSYSDFGYQLNKSINFFKVNCIFDIGANKGQFVYGLIRADYKGKVISFEPLSSAYDELIEKQKKTQIEWIVHEKCAIGDIEGEVEIFISNNSASSSILNMLDSHINAAPESIYIGSETVKIYTLDNLFHQYVCENSITLIKIDAQGFESNIIKGAHNALVNAKGVLVEMSFVYLYENQKLWEDIISILKSYGFILWSIESELIDQETGRLLQANGLFYKQ